jgi:hypothetical protein
MKRYRNYIILLAILLVVAVVLYMKDRPGTLKANSKIFAVSDTSEITKIRINNGITDLTLERTGYHWQINHSFYAKPRAIKGLLHLLANLEINSPVPKSARNEVLNNFIHKSVFVKIESADHVLKSYRITEEDSMKLGSIMMLKDDEEPYVVHLRGFNGRISMFFPVDAKIWRDKTIFSYKPGDILSVAVEYPDNPRASFIYSFFGNDNIQVKSKSLNQSIKISRETAKNYLAGFASVSYLETLDNQSKLLFDSLKNQHPYCEIQVKNTTNQVNTLLAYRIPMSQQKGKFNVDKMYAVIQSDTVPVVIKYIDFDPIMKDYSDFRTQ